LAHAARFAVEHGHSEVDALHVLRVLVEKEPVADALRSLGTDPGELADAVEQRLPEKADREVQSASITSSTQRALMEAYQVARAFGSTYIDPEHLFFAFVVNQEMPAGQLLASFGVTPQALQAGYESARAAQATGSEQGQPTASDTPMLDQLGTDLTARARGRQLGR